MKTTYFKIRTPKRSHQSPEENRMPQEEEKNIISGPNAINIHTNYQPNQDVLSILTSLASRLIPSRAKSELQYQNYIEPRDREIIIKPPIVNDGSIPDKDLKIWTASVFKTVFSSSFHQFSKNEMSFEQAKIYCSQNIFKNFALLNKTYQLNSRQFQMLDQHIVKGVLNYLDQKYPLTDSTQINKKLQEIVGEIDNIEAFQNNYLNHSIVLFEYREDGNYNDIIMKLINEIKDMLDIQNAEGESSYTDFQEFMTTLFEKVMDDDWMKKNDKEIFTAHQLKLMHYHSNIEGPQKSDNQETPQNMYDFKQIMRKKAEEKEKYKTKVKEYTHYLIGRKIPQNTANYTEKQIQSKNITIKSPAILRILTKWCQELWKKYSEVRYHTNHTQKVRVLKGRNINIMLTWMKMEIDRKLEEEKQQVKKFMDEISNNNFEMQAQIMKHEFEKEEGGFYVDQLEKISGKFSTKIVKNVHSYIIAYLNRLIHGLMKISKEIYQQNELYNSSDWPSPPNLLSFKIGDTMRCKCSSKQRQIVRIYKEIERLSKDYPQKFKIVRIKDRLKSGTNDILINVKFNNKMLCEIQLAIKSHISDFIKCSNSFHHYIYELQRSNFGPLTELCSIWSTLDKRTCIYQELIQEEKSAVKKKEHICLKLNKKFQMIRFSKPFICSECRIAYFHNNYLRQHIRCKNCEYYVCSNCQIQMREEEKLKIELVKDRQLRQNILKKIKKQQPLPKFGICIFLESKMPRVQLFQHLNYQKNRKDYLFSKKEKHIYEIQNIYTPKLNQEFRKKHLIFSLYQECPLLQKLSMEEINYYILTKTIKTNFEKENQSISLLGEKLTTEECKNILNVGNKHEKQNVKHLLLSDNRLTALPFHPKQFPNLKGLTLSRNIFQIYDNFDKLKNLKTLYWHESNLQEIPKDVYNLVELEELAMTNNNINLISSNISQLKKLKVLQLQHNKIKSFPEQIGQCESLVTIKMEDNCLTSLPKSLYSLKNLQILFINQNNIDQISSDIGNLRKLIKFNISNNPLISQLPASITSIPGLQIINCCCTNVKALPQDIDKNTNLKQIKLNDLKVQKLPKKLASLKKLITLSLNNIKSIAIADQLGKLVNLKKLSMKGCDIKQLPNIKKLQKLEVLDLSENKLTDINYDIISGLHNLTKLDADHNRFEKFPPINILTKLSCLNISFNSITEIPYEHIKYNLNIEEFIMNSNFIRCLPPLFKDLQKLRKLSLRNNCIQSLFDEDLQSELNTLEEPIWPQLILMDAGNNKLKQLPKYLCASTNLTELNISNNLLTKLPPQISNLKKLKILQMEQNQLQDIDDSLANLKKLIKLSLSKNKITIIPEFIKSLPKLEMFLADDCDIKKIQCKEWILLNQQRVALGSLPNKAYKLLYGKQREPISAKLIIAEAEMESEIKAFDAACLWQIFGKTRLEE